MVYFIFGIIFASFIQPLLDGVCSIILSFFEAIKGRIAIDITKSQKIVEENHQPASSTRSIGFVLPTEEHWEEDEDDE